MAHRPMARRLAMLVAAGSATVLAAIWPAASALAQNPLPVNYDFIAGAAATFNAPTTPPPGANNFSCKPSATHPYPVVLVHGTLANMNDNWQAAAPILANHGYCVFAFNYGGSSPTSDLQGTGDIAASAQQLAAFVNQVLAATGAAKADLVGHSQGGMMPRYYINFLGGAAKVATLVVLAPSNYGTTLDGLTELGDELGLIGPINSALSTSCTACVEQEEGSSARWTAPITWRSPPTRWPWPTCSMPSTRRSRSGCRAWSSSRSPARSARSPRSDPWRAVRRVCGRPRMELGDPGTHRPPVILVLGSEFAGQGGFLVPADGGCANTPGHPGVLQEA